MTVCQTSVVKQLQKKIEYIRMSLFHLVKQNYAVWLAANAVSQHTALFITNISRRRSNKTSHGMLFHKLAHVNPNKSTLIVKHEFSQGFGNLCLPNTGWTKHKEGRYRTVRILNTGS